jgi:hypothetical protein
VSVCARVCVCMYVCMYIPYILESNPHPFYSFRGLKMQMRIRIECGLDLRSRAGVWPNGRAGVRAVRIQGGKNEVRIRFENIRYIKQFWMQVLNPKQYEKKHSRQ